jgi:tetratricopeptide (TPR) repeat protein
MARWALPKTAGPGARLDFTFARALGEIAQKHGDAARQALADLETAAREVKDIETKRGDADPTYRIRPDILLLEARGLKAEQDNDLAVAEKLLREAISMEDTLPIAFGPPTIDKPSRELMGEFLLRRGQQEEARAEFEKALARTPGRRLSLAALMATTSKN